MLILFLTTAGFASALHRLSLTVVFFMYFSVITTTPTTYTVMEMLVLSVQRHVELQAETLIHLADLGAVSFLTSDLVAL
jgi:hypothetical protein